MKKVLLASLFLALWSATSWAINFPTEKMIPLTSSVGTQKLKNHCLYYFTGDSCIITAKDTSASALVVEDGASVFIYIAPRQVMKVYGGPGGYILPGGAGIEVPSDATLYILGGGRLVAQGGCAGKATSGGDGLPGLPLPVSEMIVGGMGGYGGCGGGGGGAGIGTKGSLGGLGALPTISLPHSWNEKSEGITGMRGFPSLSSEDCGNIYVVGPITVDAFGGRAQTQGDTIDPGSSFLSIRYGTTMMSKRDYVAGSGGGGGAGNYGLPGSGFGSGGVGAAGGGAGASGGTTHVKDVSIENLMWKMGRKFLSPVAAIIVAVSKRKQRDWAVIKIPAFNGDTFRINTKYALVAFNILKHTDFYPLQLNGYGGGGSWAAGCERPKQNGVHYCRGDMVFKDGNGKNDTISPGLGGTAGWFGDKGGTGYIGCSWLSTTNQQMPIFTRKQYPRELERILEFSVLFDTTGVKTSEPYPTEAIVVYGDTLKSRIPVPTAKDGSLFMGYYDEAGAMWYDYLGQVVPNGSDSAGKPMCTFLNPGTLNLKPRWKKFAYVVVNHWIEGTSLNACTNDLAYSIKQSEMDYSLEGSLYTAVSKSYPNLFKTETVDTITLRGDTINVLDIYYKRYQSNLVWNLPMGLRILDYPESYTPDGMTRAGAPIRAPKMAVDKTTGEYYSLSGWHEQGDQQALLSDTMPNKAVAYEPEIARLPARMKIYNNNVYGRIVDSTLWLGTMNSITVEPVEGMELDTCYVVSRHTDGYHLDPIYQTGKNTISWYAAPVADSILVQVNYRGKQHQMAYSESGDYRRGTMTWRINGDSIGNDGGLDGNHPVRYGDYVWISPMPEVGGSQVCKSLTVRSQSGQNIPVEFTENYNSSDRYSMHYTFVMPNEDVTVEASYGTLSEDLVNLRVKCDTGSVRVYSKRGQLLDSTYVFAQGYKVAAGQLVWIDFGDVWNDSTLEVDSIRIRYQTNGNSFEYESLRNVVFMETRESIEQEIDTTKLPRITGRGLFRIPPMIKEALVEIHHKGKDTAWEEETGLIIRKQEEDNRLYDIYGRYWGTSIDRLPAGVYIRGGKKVVIH